MSDLRPDLTTPRGIKLHFDTWDRDEALRVTELYARNFTNRLLPIFADIEKQATKTSAEFFDRATAVLSHNDAYYDPMDLAEQEQEHELEIFTDLQFVQQQLIGLASAGLYHLWERMLKQFLNKEFRKWQPPPVPSKKLFASDFTYLNKVLSAFGFKMNGQSFYDDLYDLRLVTNVVKHGDGKSCEELYNRTPRLFVGMGLRSFELLSTAGELLLSAEEFERFEEGVKAFWYALPAELVYYFLPKPYQHRG
jgi:hypothetical protein